MNFGFHWKREWVTPELLQAVGTIVLEWAMIDNEVTDMCKTFWSLERRGEVLPRAFDKRIDLLNERGLKLFADFPEELHVWKWFVQRIKTLNGRRDAVAHGVPGRITLRDKQQKDIRTFDGVLVEHPSKDTKLIPLSIGQIAQLADDIVRLHDEIGNVRYAFSNAVSVSTPNMEVRTNINDVMVLLTHENRPKLHQQERIPASAKLKPKDSKSALS